MVLTRVIGIVDSGHVGDDDFTLYGIDALALRVSTSTRVRRVLGMTRVSLWMPLLDNGRIAEHHEVAGSTMRIG